MFVSVPDVLLIPYGIAECSPEGISLEGFSVRSLRLRTAFPCAVINRAAREPLRFNTSRYDFNFAPNAQAGASDEAGLVKDYLTGLCRPWDNVATGFVDAYLEFLSDQLDEQRETLERKLAPYDGLYGYRDWLFSAPKPIPRAHLHAPPDAGVSDASSGSAAFIGVDFAFWLGDRLVAARNTQSALMPKRAREQTDRLRLAGVQVISFSAADLVAGKARDLFKRLLGPSLHFWNGQTLPAGPFRPSMLDE